MRPLQRVAKRFSVDRWVSAILSISYPLQRFAKRFGLDRAVALSLVSRIWTAVAGVLTLSLLLRFLTPVQQGFYSAFGSFMALQVFFELGLSFVILQFASHERAKLEWTEHGTLAGDPVAKARLKTILRRSLLWYGVCSGIMMAVVFPIGLAFFRKYQPAGSHLSWQMPWFCLALAVSGSLAVTPLYAVLEGCGVIAEVIAAQFVAGLGYNLLFWLLLFLHCDLYASPLAGLANWAGMVVWLWTKKGHFFRDLIGGESQAESISWRYEIWPFQWKIALSWLSGYFIFELFVPVLFAYQGAVTAGQMGLTLNVTLGVSSIALAWVTTKSAPFGSLVAQSDWAELDRRFFPCLWQSLSVLILGCALLWCAVVYLHFIGHHIGRRMLPPLPFLLLLLATIANHVVVAEAIYLRAHKQEPFLIPSLVGGCLIGLSTYFTGRYFGATGMMGSYLFFSLVVGLGLGTWIFVQKRKAWHGEAVGSAS